MCSSPGRDPDPSDSEWETASTVLRVSSAVERQREDRTYDPKMDRKIFLLKFFFLKFLLN